MNSLNDGAQRIIICVIPEAGTKYGPSSIAGSDYGDSTTSGSASTASVLQVNTGPADEGASGFSTNCTPLYFTKQMAVLVLNVLVWMFLLKPGLMHICLKEHRRSVLMVSHQPSF